MRYNTELSFCIAEGGLLKLKGAVLFYLINDKEASG